MAILDNNSREIVGGITQISDQTTDPTTAGDDLISLSGTFLLVGTTSGLIDGLGETSADTLELTSPNLSGVDIVNIEATQIQTNGTTIIDANEIADLGAFTITDVFSSTGFDANLRLNFSGGAASFSSIFGAQSALGDDERLSVTTTGQLATHNVTLDFSNIARTGVDSYLSYTGGIGNETVTGTTGDDSINASRGTNSITGGDGDDSLTVFSGLSTVQGGAGNDTITSSTASGLFEGGADDDVMNISNSHTIGGIRQASTIDGGAGMDTLNVSSLQGVGSIVDAGSEDDTVVFNGATLTNSTLVGGAGTDQLQINGANLTGTDISGIEGTLFASNGTVTVDADKITNLGAISITNVFSSTANDANLTLNFAGFNATSTSFAALSSLGMGERFNIGTTGQIAGQTATIDFSNIGRGTGDGSYLRYAGGSADETITGTTGDDSINASSGTNSVSGGVGNDVLATSAGYSTVLGGAGEDTISTFSTSGLFDGGADNDTINVSISFNDNGRQPSTILGGTGDDQLTVTSVQGTGTIVDAGTDDDTIILTSATLVDATVDGGSGTDQLRMTGTNLTGGTISGIESTLITGNGTNSLDADQVANLGVLDITDVFSSTAFDANMTLNFAGLGTSVSTSFGALSGLDAGERIHITTAGQTSGQSVNVDFSGIGRGSDDGSELRYSGFIADETIIGTDGEDNINTLNGEASVSGGKGDDILSTSSGYVTILGGDGNDTISTSASSGIIDGGADNDRLTISGSFSDGVRQPSTITGGSGFDEIYVSSVLGDGSSIDGGSEDDTISLTSVTMLNGTLDGGSGTDQLRVTGANFTGTEIANIENTVFASNSTTTIDADDIANLGNIDLTDVFSSTAYDVNITLNYAGLGTSVTTDFGGLTQFEAGERLSISTIGQTSGLDAILDFSGVGHAATDTYLRYAGSAANETITGSAGADELIAFSGTNFVDAGAGDDSLRGQSGYSTLLGGDGEDTIFGSGASGVFDGGADNDILTLSGAFNDGGRQPSTILGGTGDDQISLASTFGDASLVDAGANNDTISVSFGTLLSGTVDGGAGADELRLSGANFTGTDISNIESTVFTSNGTTRIASTEIADLGAVTATDVFGGTGGRDANLILVDAIGQTADFSNLTLGVDQRFYVTYAFVANGVTTIDFSGATGDASSILEFDGGSGTGRDDLVIASDITDDINGGSSGDDTISYQGSDAGVIIEISTQSVSGGFADGDTISGFEHATGSEFGDDFTGDTDDNIFTGLGGSDTYNSGVGDDVVVITNLNGNDLWNDFTSGGGANRVDLRALNNDDAILGFLTASEQLGNTVLSFNSGGSIILTGEALSNFDTNDVLLNDGVYTIDESLTTTEDQVLTGNILDPNPPLGFGDLEIISNMIAAPGGIEVQDFTVEGFQYLAGTTATFSSGATLTVLSSGAFTYNSTSAIGAQSLNELLIQTLSQDFSYTAVSTVTGETDQGDVSLTVTAVNDAPIITGSVDTTATEDGAPVVIDLLSTSQDVDDQDMLNAVNLGVLPAGASVLNNQLTVDPDHPDYQSLSQGETTTVSLTYSVQDQSGATVPGGQANVVITGTNDAPTLAAGVITPAVEDGPSVTFDLTALGADIDSEDDGTTLTYAVTGQPSEGSASILPDGDTLSFDPGSDFQDLTAGETRLVTVQITATDAQGDSAVNDMLVTVIGVGEIASTPFNDLLQGTFESDTLDGLGGDDTIYGAGDNDTINGGTDSDQLFGNAGQDSILGGGGNDLIFGNDDNDTIEAGAGNDTVSGGSGRDTIYGNGEDDSIRGDGDADRLIGGFGNDTLDGGFGWDVLIGNDNNDLLLGRVGNDRLDGGAGRDTLEGGAGDDNLIGAGGDDVLRGGGGVDRMFGGFGNDLLEGSWGWDVLVGNNGQDTLNGGIGNDRLTGGNDADVFIFASGDGTDAITDYQDGVDQIQILSGASSAGDLTIYNDAGDAIVEFDNVTVRLENVVHTTLDASDFLF
ncbi:MAG: hypothetical protein MK098_09370 [Marinovum sp.]|nr:hypothetical protein [Marinovum sp.]